MRLARGGHATAGHVLRTCNPPASKALGGCTGGRFSEDRQTATVRGAAGAHDRKRSFSSLERGSNNPDDNPEPLFTGAVWFRAVDNAAVVQRHFSRAQFNVDRPGFVNLG